MVPRKPRSCGERKESAVGSKREIGGKTDIQREWREEEKNVTGMTKPVVGRFRMLDQRTTEGAPESGDESKSCDVWVTFCRGWIVFEIKGCVKGLGVFEVVQFGQGVCDL